MLKKTICIDFGNTRKKIAIFLNENITDIIYLENDELATAKKIIDNYKPNSIILSSVIKHNIDFESYLNANCNFHLLNIQSKLNFTSPATKPETIGADRLALCSAAVRFFPNQHTLIIGTGSCVTYNFINNKAQFLGGAISPGMNMRFKSMNDFTNLLPLVNATHSIPLIGYDTPTNLQTGVLLGLAYEIDGFITAYKEAFSEFNVVLTGGDTVFFERHLKSRIFADQNFLFKGLYAISEINT